MLADGLFDRLEDADQRTSEQMFSRGASLAATDANGHAELGDVVIVSGSEGPEVPETIFVAHHHGQEDFGPKGDQRWGPLADPAEVIGGDRAVGGEAAHRRRDADLTLPPVKSSQMFLQVSEIMIELEHFSN